MDFLAELAAHYESIKKQEWKGEKKGPPDFLASLMWKKDQVALLFGFRAYARLITYGFVHKQSSIGLREDDFMSLWVAAKRRREQIEKVPVLKAYRSIIDLVRTDISELEPGEVDRQITYLYGNQGRMGREDYVDCTSMLFNYCLRWANQGDTSLLSELLQLNIMTIDGKFGKQWSPRKDKSRRLSHSIFSNTALLALKANDRKDWRDTYMEVIELPVENEVSVYDWIDAYLKAYKSRVDEKHRSNIVAYVKLRVAIHREDFPLAARILSGLENCPYEFYGMTRRMLALITYYELRYCNGGKAHPAIRRLNINPESSLRNLKMNVRDLQQRQKTLLPHARNFQFFTDGYTDLLALRREVELLGRSEKRRSSHLRKRRPEVLAGMAEFRQQSGEWLRTKVAELR